MISPLSHLKIWRTTLLVWLICISSFSASAEQATPTSRDAEADIRFWLGSYIDVWMGDIHPSHDPAIAYNSLHNEFLAVWVVNQDDYTHDLWARRVKVDGTMPSWFCLLSLEAEILNRPSVAYNLTQDEYLIVYERRFSDTDYDIWGIRLRGDGGMIYTPFPISLSFDSETYPSVSYNSQQNQYLVAYHRENDDGRYTIFLHLIDSTGTNLENGEITSAVNEFRVQPEMVYNPSRNQYLVVYGYETTFSAPRVKGKLINADLSGIIASAEQIYDAPTMGKFNA